MTKGPAFLSLVLLVVGGGCHQIPTPSVDVKADSQNAVLKGHAGAVSAKPNGDAVNPSARLKRLEYGNESVLGDRTQMDASGLWLPESNDPKKALVFPEQVQITCTSANKVCVELTVPLGVMGGMIEVMDIEEKDWQIVSWDEHSLLAAYGPDASKTASAFSRCHHHVLTMTFASRAVSTSDIPTHEKGCEEFTETDAYRLVRGNYYVDTTPGNDMDKR